ncbi:MAG TPA: WD40 repeat domain-containing protein [Bryobacteraceae bacterium]|nr:WD40 repeat domain-containing protein [Bryobacteraceae bacterium]
MKPAWFAATAAIAGCGLQLAAGEMRRDVLSLDYAKETGLVAAAYRGGQVVVWEFESGRVKKVFNQSAPKSTLNEPLAQFNASGRLLAYTQEGDAGLISHNLDADKSTVLVPHRLLVHGITAFNWSRQTDFMLVAIGRDIFLIDAAGHTQWQRRLETRAIITDVVWHPSEKFYTVATDNGEVSTWDTATGRVIVASKLETGGHSAAVKVGWTSEDSVVVAVRGISLALLDPETLKPKKTVTCNCWGFAWSGNGKEIFAWAPPNIGVFSEAGQKTRELRTPFDGEGPVVWAGEGRLLTAFTDSAVVLRDARNGKVLRTFAP